MFLKVKKMPKLFRFTAADSRGVTRPSRRKRIVRSQKKGEAARFVGGKRRRKVTIDYNDRASKEILQCRWPLCGHVETIVSAPCSLIIFIAVTVDRNALGFRWIDTDM